MATGGLVVNLRGTSGAGKTDLARRLMMLYGGTQVGAAGTALTRHGRTRPIVWVLPHPGGGRPLAVLGDYDGGAARGGCDTIPLRDGGMAEAFRLADDLARDGHDVLLEGLALSADGPLRAEQRQVSPRFAGCRPRAQSRRRTTDRRLHPLWGWSREPEGLGPVFGRGPAARGADGSRSRRPPRLAAGGDRLDRGQDRLPSRDLRQWARQAERTRVFGPGR